MSELKNCPFCVQPDVLTLVVETEFVSCTKCGCQGPIGKGYSEVIAAWNRRPTADTMYAALLAVQALFAREGFYIAKADCAEGIIGPADHEAIDATFVQVAAALRAAGEAK